MELFLSTLINGLSLGGIYAMIALGYTMVYGIAKNCSLFIRNSNLMGHPVLYLSTLIGRDTEASRPGRGRH